MPPTKPPPKLDDVVEKLEQRVKQDASYFTEAEYEALHKIVEAYRAWSVLGRGVRWVVFGLAALAAAMTAGETIVEKLKAWFTG